jgi:hypothetical protein
MIRLLRSNIGLVLVLPEGRGSGAQRAPGHHIIPYRNSLQVPCPRQESSSTISIKYYLKALPSHCSQAKRSNEASREAKRA